jgi:uncharacterized protein (TIGR03435 family)
MKAPLPTPLVATMALAVMAVQSRAPEQRFEAAVVKRYDHRNDHKSPWGMVPYFGCYLGPSRLQYNCSGSVTRLVAEALNLSDFQFEKAGPPEYVITAKLSDPATRQQMNDMLAHFLQEHMGIRFHLEKRTIKAEFLTVADPELLKKLPASHDPVPPAEASSPGMPMPTIGQFFDQKPAYDGGSQIICKNINLYLLAQILHRYYGVPVIDETGLTTRFDLDFTTKINLEAPTVLGEARYAVNLPEIRKLLGHYGIGLQRREGVTEFLVVDHVASEAAFLN